MDRSSFIGRLLTDTSPRSDPKSPDVEDDQSGVSFSFFFFAHLFAIAPYEKAEGGQQALIKGVVACRRVLHQIDLGSFFWCGPSQLSIRYPLSLFSLLFAGG